MNIAIIVTGLGDGGAEKSAQLVGDYYVEHGQNVVYFLINNVEQLYKVKGKIVYLDNALNESSTIWDFIKVAFQIRKEKSKWKIDKAISYMEMANILNVMSKGRETVLVSVRTALSPRNELKGIYYNKNLIRYFYNRADYVVSVSDYVKNDLKKVYKLNQNIIKTIPNPSIQKNYEKNDWVYGEKAIIFVGRLSYIKQIDRIIRAFSYVNKVEAKSELIIIGKGDQEEYLRGISKKYEIENKVHFEGYCNSIGQYYENGRVFVMASKAEGFPNAMVEAMAHGMPVVTTDCPGGCGEIVGKKNESKEVQLCRYGILTPYIVGKPFFSAPIDNEEIELAKGLLKIICDDQLYTYYRKMSFERAKYYSYETVMSKWDDLLTCKI